jgi:cyanophycinase
MLAIVGSGEYLTPMDPVDRELIRRLPQPVRVVCLPTAAGQEGPERIHYWMDLGIGHFRNLGVEVEALPVIDRASADNQAFADRVSKSNFVYLSGGNPHYLHLILDGSKVWDAILQVLDRGGMLAGCSAGAMIMGEKIFGFPGWNPGFDFLPGIAVIPHFNEIPKSFISSIRLFTGKGLTIVGVDGYTCLLKTGNRYEVLGIGGVTVWNKSRKTVFQQGSDPGEAFNS